MMGGFEYITKDHLRLYRPRASVNNDGSSRCSPHFLCVHILSATFVSVSLFAGYFIIHSHSYFIAVFFFFSFLLDSSFFIFPLKSRARGHNRDWLPLDINYTLLECLKNRSVKGLLGKCHQVFLYVLLISFWNILF